MHARTRRHALGISLIEALVALAVMAFGMLGVVGMQSTLRFNADMSRQRAEAVRLAQDELERWRAYGVLRPASAASGQLAFEDIVDTGPDTLLVAEVNTQFSRETLVVPEAASSPRVREVRVIVRWQDRRGNAQEVQLTSQIGYVPPELAALVAQRADRGPVGQPGGRNPVIPQAAVPVDPVTSRFDPPGGGGLGWIFNNDTGLIVAVCPPPPSSTCTPANRQLVTGSFGFAISGAPSKVAAEVPSDPMPTGMALGVVVRYTLPTPAGVETCFTDETPDRRRVVYYCAVPVNLSRQWTGVVDPIVTVASVDARASETYSLSGPSVETALPTDFRDTRFRICRYTPVAVNRRTVDTSSGLGPLAARLQQNSRHPWRYIFADAPYTARNFLVIRAGDGVSVVYDCPTEDTATAIQSNTHHHPRVVP